MSLSVQFKRVSMLCIGAVVALAAEASDPAPAAETAVLRGHPDNLSMDIRLSYDEDGAVARRQDSIRLSCSFPLAGHPDLVGYEDLVLDTIVFDNGVTLEPEANVDREERFRDYVLKRGEFSVSFPLTRIPEQAKTITAIRGHFIAMIKRGEPRLAELNPISKWLGKRVAVKDIAGAIISVEEVGKDMVVVSYNDAAREALDEITYRDGAGREVPTSGYSGSGSGSNYTRRQRMRREIGEDGAVIFRFHGEVERRAMEILVEDVPVDMEPRKAVDAVISSTPASQADAAADAAAEDAAADGATESALEAVEDRGAEGF